jgi:hypothetical protein
VWEYMGLMCVERRKCVKSFAVKGTSVLIPIFLSAELQDTECCLYTSRMDVAVCIRL